MNAPASHRSTMVDKVISHQADRLEANEPVIAALLAGRSDRVQPRAATGFSVYSMLGPLGRVMEQALGENEVGERRRQVTLMARRKGMELVGLPKTKHGYAIALTDRRFVVCDASAKTFLTESPLHDIRLERLDHADGKVSLFICLARDAVAVTSWETHEVTDHFIEAFHTAQVATFSSRS